MKPQRIRDPLHNLIEFGSNQLERTLWQVIQTPSFQRLRRVRQLGFSEFVFPGATHTRFAHSIGVFHTARKLMQIVKHVLGDNIDNHQQNVALAASLVHDVGHGMFSHAFEKIGKELDLPMARHEIVSEKLIRDGEIACAFKELGSGFAKDVADLLKQEMPRNLYDSVVSSQFDADRLDYMQRDRIMTGVQSSGIDATWLLANLEVGKVSASADDESLGSIETLVLSPKAFHAAENYVLSLFQLYPNVYMHKTTKGAEELFTFLMLRLIDLVREGHADKTGLPDNHPICRFARNSNQLECTLALDDTVFWGALPLMVDAKDQIVKLCGSCLKERRLPKCIDIRRKVEENDPIKPNMSEDARKEREANVQLQCKKIGEGIRKVTAEREPNCLPIFVDQDRRTPYKKFQDSKTQLNQILIKYGERRFEDMAHLSAVVSSAETFEICRAYHFEDDKNGKDMIEEQIKNI